MRTTAVLAQKIKQYTGVPIGTARYLQNNDGQYYFLTATHHHCISGDKAYY
jgi:hypothetical protein